MDWILRNAPRIGELALDHLALSLPAVLTAFLLSVPLAVLANRLRLLREPIISGTGLLYACPPCRCSSCCRSSWAPGSVTPSTWWSP